MRWLTLLAGVLLCAACDHGRADRAALPGGISGLQRAQLREGKALISANCGACHRVPSVPGAQGRVGPSLAEISRQQMIAGHFANTPENLAAWIEHPQRLLPGDAMPEMGLTHREVLTIVDYLYTTE